MEKDNVYVLFEEIKNKIDMINGKLDQKAGTPTDGTGRRSDPDMRKAYSPASF